MYTYICENSIDGILTGVYDAYADRRTRGEIHLSAREPENLSLFTSYLPIKADPDKAARVARTLKSRFGQEFYETIYQKRFSLSASHASTGCLSCAAQPERRRCTCLGLCAFRSWKTASSFPPSIQSTMYCRSWASIFPTGFRRKIL